MKSRQLIRILLLTFSLFIVFFFSFFLMYVDSYEEVAFENGGYLFSILTVTLLLIYESMQRSNFIFLEKESLNNFLSIQKKKMYKIAAFSSYQTFRMVIFFGFYEIILFFVLKFLFEKHSFELLYFGIAFLTILPISEFLKVIFYFEKEDYSLLKLKYNLTMKSIQVESGQEIINIDHNQVKRVIKYKDLLLLRIKGQFEYLIIKKEKK